MSDKDDEAILPGSSEPPVSPLADEVSPSQPSEEEREHQAAAQKAADIEAADEQVLAASRQRTRRSFLYGSAGAAAAFGFYQYLDFGPQDKDQPSLLRDSFETNSKISKALFRDQQLAPTYPVAKAENLRVNGVFGLKKLLPAEGWRLQVVGVKDASAHRRFSPDVTAWVYPYTDEKTGEDTGHDTKVDPARMQKAVADAAHNYSKDGPEPAPRIRRGREEAGESKSTLAPGTPGLLLPIEDVLQLPRHELVTQFKCIEGWSQIVHWAGVRMADFLEMYPPLPVNGKDPGFVYMETPDGDYYTGYDMEVMRHPQTLLVTEMMGAPLTQFHGAPLRLHMPTKYGYKQIKRIGLVAYTVDRPDDYWTKLGYDWEAGL